MGNRMIRGLLAIGCGMVLFGKSPVFASQGAYTDHCRYSGVAVPLGTVASVTCTVSNTKNEPFQFIPGVIGVPSGVSAIGVNGGPLSSVVAGSNYSAGAIGAVIQPGQSGSFTMQFQMSGQKSVEKVLVNLSSTASANYGYLAESPVVIGVDSGVPVAQNLSVTRRIKRRSTAIQSSTVTFQAPSSAVSVRVYLASPGGCTTFNTASGPLDDIVYCGNPIASGGASSQSISFSGGISAQDGYYAVVLVDAQGRESLPVFIR